MLMPLKKQHSKKKVDSDNQIFFKFSELVLKTLNFISGKRQIQKAHILLNKTLFLQSFGLNSFSLLNCTVICNDTGFCQFATENRKIMQNINSRKMVTRLGRVKTLDGISSNLTYTGVEVQIKIFCHFNFLQDSKIQKHNKMPRIKNLTNFENIVAIKKQKNTAKY